MEVDLFIELLNRPHLKQRGRGSSWWLQDFSPCGRRRLGGYPASLYRRSEPGGYPSCPTNIASPATTPGDRRRYRHTCRRRHLIVVAPGTATSAAATVATTAASISAATTPAANTTAATTINIAAVTTIDADTAVADATVVGTTFTWPPPLACTSCFLPFCLFVSTPALILRALLLITAIP